MVGGRKSPPPRSSQLPPSPAASKTPRVRRPPAMLGDWEMADNMQSGSSHSEVTDEDEEGGSDTVVRAGHEEEILCEEADREIQLGTHTGNKQIDAELQELEQEEEVEVAEHATRDGSRSQDAAPNDAEDHGGPFAAVDIVRPVIDVVHDRVKDTNADPPDRRKRVTASDVFIAEGPSVVDGIEGPVVEDVHIPESVGNANPTVVDDEILPNVRQEVFRHRVFDWADGGDLDVHQQEQEPVVLQHRLQEGEKHQRLHTICDEEMEVFGDEEGRLSLRGRSRPVVPPPREVGREENS